MMIKPRERNLLNVVGLVILIGLVYIYWTGGFSGTPTEKNSSASSTAMTLSEAQSLLAEELNIRAKLQASREGLAALEARFLSRENREASQIQLLNCVEELSRDAHLTIAQKSFTQTGTDTIGTYLEGTTRREQLFVFLEQLHTSPITLQVKRLRIGTGKNGTDIDYQILLTTQLLEKRTR